MSVSKEERYAMIRRAALKIQKRNKISKSNAILAKEVVRLDEQDYKANVRWQDGDSFVNVRVTVFHKTVTVLPTYVSKTVTVL